MVRQHVFLHGFFSVTHIITFGARIFEETFMPRTHVARHVTFLSTPVVAMGATIRFYVRVPGTNMAVKIGFLRTTVIAILASMWFIAIVGTHVPCHVRRMICLVLADLADEKGTLFLFQQCHGGLGMGINHTFVSVGGVNDG